jgi:hypothetical protein
MFRNLVAGVSIDHASTDTVDHQSRALHADSSVWSDAVVDVVLVPRRRRGRGAPEGVERLPNAAANAANTAGTSSGQAFSIAASSMMTAAITNTVAGN